MTMNELLVIMFLSLGTIILVAAIVPYSLAVLPFVFLLLWRIKFVYLASSREIKRLEAITRSPIYAFLSTALNGNHKHCAHS